MSEDYYGLRTESIENAFLRLDFLAEAGPRIVRLAPAGSEVNLLAEVPEITWDTPFGKYALRGGHRLWHAPEIKERVSIPDNEGLSVEWLADGVLLTQPTEAPTRITKSMAIHVHADRPTVTLDHRLKNDGLWPVELAPWAITQVPLGGLAVLPQEPATGDSEDLLPNRHLVLWPYTRLDDPRLRFDDTFILLEGREGLPPPSAFKIGTFNHQGWLGYFRQRTFFRKRFGPQPDLTHPDHGCNTEVYANYRFLELESLGPLKLLEPGQSLLHTEEWEVYTGIEQPQTLQEVGAAIEKLGI